jgi:hypothetical protein
MDWNLIFPIQNGYWWVFPCIPYFKKPPYLDIPLFLPSQKPRPRLVLTLDAHVGLHQQGRSLPTQIRQLNEEIEGLLPRTSCLVNVPRGCQN